MKITNHNKIASASIIFGATYGIGMLLESNEMMDASKIGMQLTYTMSNVWVNSMSPIETNTGQMTISSGHLNSPTVSGSLTMPVISGSY
jgi:hypothetical protein